MMPAEMATLARDLAAETAVTHGLAVGLDEAGWRPPTPAAGWDIADQIGHLAYFDEAAVCSAVRQRNSTPRSLRRGPPVASIRMPSPPGSAIAAEPRCWPGWTRPAPSCLALSPDSIREPGCRGSARP